MGYNTSESRGADTFHPFKSGLGENLIPVMSSESEGGYEVIASSITGVSNKQLAKAFDGDEATSSVQHSQSASSAPWIGIKFPVAKIATKYQAMFAGSNTYFPILYFEASNDGTTWTTLDTYQSYAPAILLREFDNSTPYSYFRIRTSKMMNKDTYGTYYFEMKRLDIYE